MLYFSLLNIIIQIGICIFTLIKTRKKKITGIKLWNFGNILYTIGFILLAINKLIDLDFLPIANTLVAVGISSLIVSILNFKGINFSLKQILILNIICFICFISFLYFNVNTKNITIVISIFFIILYSFLYFHLNKNHKFFYDSEVSMFNILIILSCIIYIIRVIYTINANIFNIGFIFNADLISSLTIVLQLVTLFTISISLFIIIIKDYDYKLQLKIDDLNKNKKYITKMNEQFICDIKMAKSIQNSLLPNESLGRNSIKFLVNIIPTATLSGDSYNYFNIDDKHVLFYISDVSGHGVSAAMLTVFLNQCIKSSIEKIEDSSKPSEILNYLYNEYNICNFSNEAYILLLLFIYNTETQKIYYSSAGLNMEPIYISGNGECKHLYISGFPICNLKEIYVPSYIDHVINVNSNDKIFLYTDGLTDLENKSVKYTYTRLFNLISQHANGSGKKIFDTLTNDIEVFLECSDGIKDDLTYMIIEFNFES